MKKFFECLTKHTRRIIDFKKIKLLTNKLQVSYETAKICYIFREKFEDKHAKDKKYFKVRDNCLYAGECRGAAYNIKT